MLFPFSKQATSLLWSWTDVRWVHLTNKYFGIEVFKQILRLPTATYYAFQFGSKNWPEKLTGVTCFQITKTWTQVKQGQFLRVEF